MSIIFDLIFSACLLYCPFSTCVNNISNNNLTNIWIWSYFLFNENEKQIWKTNNILAKPLCLQEYCWIIFFSFVINYLKINAFCLKSCASGVW